MSNDPFSTRYHVMRSVPTRNSVPELLLRRELHRLGLRYRLHVPGLPGRPDIAFPRQQVAVFVHGCFWHRHDGCPRATTPKSNVEFWRAKFDANVARDGRNCRELESLGWLPFIVWECEVRGSPVTAANRVAGVIADRRRETGADKSMGNAA